MAIRMKEWGMLSAPGAGVRIPVQGVMGWDTVARSLGSGIASFIEGSAALAEEKEQVTATGDLAEFSRRLHAISDETRAELSERDVEDWDYSWQQLSSPRFAEAVGELPPAARRAGWELADAYSRQASLQALRDREVGKLRAARSQWQQRVEAAVQDGDTQRAEAWLQSGAGVFVAPSEMEAQRRQVRSRACAAGWRSAMERDPLQALADYGEARAEALPQEADGARRLQSEAEQCRRRTRAELAEHLASQVLSEAAFDRDLLQRAERAGVLSTQQRAAATAAPGNLSPAERCMWMRRVDETDGEAESLTSLKMDIATAAIPAEERRALLQRLEQAVQVSPADRRTLSRSLWQLYDSGSLGCPGDAMALQRLSNLQKEGLPLLAQAGSEAAARWVAGVRRDAGHWVCFEQKK
ncbi:MAG: hypothetical protein Q4F38_07255 [Akkermansia sp.]|nr:hypothetical protein [Akkermansia sp.]